jgi:hypothetical protein
MRGGRLEQTPQQGQRSQGGSDRSSYWLSDIGRQRQPGGVIETSDDSLRLSTECGIRFFKYSRGCGDFSGGGIE